MKRALLATLTLLLLTETTYAGEWSESVVVRRRGEPVVTYRAKLEGDILVVEAMHAEGWHTYAMDNVERARAKTGKELPETELPTRIEVTGGLELVGGWRQSPPKDLSQEIIQWYTWGFNDTGRFAAVVVRSEGAEATITVKAQACNTSSCQMVDGVVLTLPLPESLPGKTSGLSLGDLVPLKPAASSTPGE